MLILVDSFDYNRLGWSRIQLRLSKSRERPSDDSTTKLLAKWTGRLVAILKIKKSQTEIESLKILVFSVQIKD